MALYGDNFPSNFSTYEHNQLHCLIKLSSEVFIFCTATILINKPELLPPIVKCPLLCQLHITNCLLLFVHYIIRLTPSSLNKDQPEPFARQLFKPR
jgi:hypothetical protein